MLKDKIKKNQLNEDMKNTFKFIRLTHQIRDSGNEIKITS
jgi:hypothetical protein